jgi:hypothetical protein
MLLGMPEHLAYTTSKRKTKPIEFQIDGEDYEFTAPKKAVMALPVMEQDDADSMAMMVIKSQFDWLEAGLAEGQAERIKEKLSNPKDDFDMDDLERVLEWIMKQVNGRPTG